jgi:hypothetical protein
MDGDREMVGRLLLVSMQDQTTPSWCHPGGVITSRMERAQDMQLQSFEAVHEDNEDELALVPARQLTPGGSCLGSH